MTPTHATASPTTSSQLLHLLDEWLRDAPGLHPGQFLRDPGTDDLLLADDIACGQALLSLFTRIAAASVQADGPVHVEARRIPIGTEIGVRFQPTPAFTLFLKQYMEDGGMEATQSSIPTMPDALVSLFTSRRVAHAFGVRTLYQIDQHKNAALFAFLKKPSALPRPPRPQPEVLIIEDTSPIGMLVELYLRQGGFKTMLATDSLRGLGLAKERHPDLITLDVMMPGLDGWEVLRRVRREYAGHQIDARDGGKTLDLAPRPWSEAFDRAVDCLCQASDLNASDTTPYLFLGRMLNADMEFYRLAGIRDVGRLKVHMMTGKGYDERGVIGLGEPPVISPGAAISNAVANAIGAAVARPTLTLNLRIDTERGEYAVAEEGTIGKVGDRKMGLEQAEAMARKLIAERAKRLGVGEYAKEAEVTYSEIFNMVRGWSTVGRLLDVRMEIPAGILASWGGVS